MLIVHFTPRSVVRGRSPADDVVHLGDVRLADVDFERREDRPQGGHFPQPSALDGLHRSAPGPPAIRRGAKAHEGGLLAKAIHCDTRIARHPRRLDWTRRGRESCIAEQLAWVRGISLTSAAIASFIVARQGQFVLSAPG